MSSIEKTEKAIRKDAKEAVVDQLQKLKRHISLINEVAVTYEVFVDEPTILLNLSCSCDEIIGIIENQDGKGRY